MPLRSNETAALQERLHQLASERGLGTVHKCKEAEGQVFLVQQAKQVGFDLLQMNSAHNMSLLAPGPACCQFKSLLGSGF